MAMQIAWRRWGVALVLLLIVVAGGVVAWPTVEPWLNERFGAPPSELDASHSDHDDHDHAHGEAGEIELSPQALKTIGYEPLKVALGDFERTISLPGIVVERPGKSQIRVSAPLGGIITKVYPIQGEAIAPSAPMFEVRLTHEELVSAQGEFLKTVEQLDVVNQEIRRLQNLTEGVVPGRRVVEQQYERQKLEGQLRAQRQSLLLHGLSQSQVDAIQETRVLLQSLVVRAPDEQAELDCRGDHMFHVQSIDVQPGQQVAAGELLAVLADHCELYIEGTAFEDDAEPLRQALDAGANISADLLRRDRREHAIDGLKLFYVADRVELDTRALHFYIKLPNTIALDRTEGEHRFLQWQFNPGQRVELRVPVQRWEQRIVLPATAVVSEGAESYVYERKGRKFYRVPVQVEYRDRQSVVVANDGAISPGDLIAARGAFEIHLTLKNQAGGGIDPHAGHSH